MNNKTCIIIVGPTAVGKTALAIQVAQHFNTEIISADSRQCYRELNIGVAKPSPEELAAVKHHFINSHSIHEEVNARVFEQYALNKAAEIFSTKDIVVMVGGTGLYVNAFCNGIDEIPVIEPTIREEVISNYEQLGIEWLQEAVQKNDPVYFGKGEFKNPQRMMRALEVKLATGRSILDFQTQKKEQRDFNIIKVGLELPKEQLQQNINTRVDLMMQQGLLEEVKLLLPEKNLNALQTVGYRELFDHLENKISLEEAVEQIKISTRQYAKRQKTWFRKDKEVQWSKPEFESAMSLIKGV
ncbi:MAG TPA: tRNA (adenosine(37)-N6)-dimethylallyltransferase MiaA [Ferruginibacter sp.]|nr:tRNA (adenosine(37)-N6)-dimethylallyltransferase MiaA [Ferruginibacter sp.]